MQQRMHAHTCARRQACVHTATHQGHARTHAATHAHTQSPCKTQTQETAANVGERVEEGRQSGSQVGGSACVTLSLLLGRPALVACTLFRECVLSPSCSSPFLRSSQLPRLTYIHTHTGCRGGARTRGQSCTTAQCRGEGSGDRCEGCCGGEGTGACLLGLLSATALRCRRLWCKRGCSFLASSLANQIYLSVTFAHRREQRLQKRVWEELQRRRRKRQERCAAWQCHEAGRK